MIVSNVSCFLLVLITIPDIYPFWKAPSHDTVSTDLTTTIVIIDHYITTETNKEKFGKYTDRF